MMEVDWSEVVGKLSRKIAQLEVENAVLQAAVDKYVSDQRDESPGELVDHGEDS